MFPLAAQSETSFSPDGLIVGPKHNLHAVKMVLLAGTLLRGAVVGRVLVAGTPTAGATNTVGSGTIASFTLGAGAKPGNYKVVCVEPASNLGTFEVYEPGGEFIGRAIAGSAFAGAVNFTATDATDYVAGDFFILPVTYSDTDVRLAVAAATDGSQHAFGILAVDADASAAEVECLVYDRGVTVDPTKLSFGAGHSASTVRDALAANGIYLDTPHPA